MIRILYFDSNGQCNTEISPEELPAALSMSSSVVWVDIAGQDPQSSEKLLREVFNFHPLAIDDALRETHIPKVDDWESYLYLVMHDIAFERGDGELEISELDIFLGANYLVTHHEFPIQGLERAWNACSKDARHNRRGADHLLYRVGDEIVSDFMKTVDAMDEEIEQIEDHVFHKADPGLVQKIFTLKRATLHLRRSLSPLREVFNKLARDDYKVIDTRDQIYFRDVYDHLVRLHDISEGMRDLASGVLDTYLSVVNNRMNEVMKTLTVITSVFMPISFLAGFFGMNYFQPASASLTPWTNTASFAISMVVFIGIPIGMLLWMRWRGWT